MAQATETQKQSYREMMASVAKASDAPRTPTNYISDFSWKAGAFAGFMGAVAIMAIIGILAGATGQSVFLSPRIIASVILRGWAETGFIPVIVGTIMHLGAGTFYGALFGAITPKMPRGFWIVAGLLYAMAVWATAAIALPILVADIGVSNVAYITALTISHATFGIFLGVAASLYGLRKM